MSLWNDDSTINCAGIVDCSEVIPCSGLNLRPNTVNSNSVALNPTILFTQLQVIGLVTAYFAPSIVTVNFKD